MSYITNQFDEKVVELLRSGGVGLIPTDTIYGLSARALDHNAVKKLHALKDRGESKPFIILISDINQLPELGINSAEAALVKEFWPGELTYICQAPEAPVWLQLGTKTLAIRLPNHSTLGKLIRQTGPLISTSANHKGQKPAESVSQARRYFKDQLDFYIDTGDLEKRQPSTIVKQVNGKLIVIREGAVKI